MESPKLLIENEVYFPGWQATLIEESGQKVIQAIPVNQLFRGWLLPAGQYQMIAKFSFPDQSLYVFISMVAVMLWIIVSLSIMGIFRFSVIWHTKTEDGVN